MDKYTGFEINDKTVIMRIRHRLCETAEELILSDPFRQVLINFINALSRRNSMLLGVFGAAGIKLSAIDTLISTLLYLTKMDSALVLKISEEAEPFFKDPALFLEFTEQFYNYWRSYDRYIICDSANNDFDRRPYRTFNDTIEQLGHLVRSAYRDIQENIIHAHPKIYRQVRAGAEIACISTPKPTHLKDPVYHTLNNISVIRQILLNPPLILDPPMNKRTGEFERVSVNPMSLVTLKTEDWLCYPAKVGVLTILIYIHKQFYDLGFSLCNLFELADDADLIKKPDAIYVYGIPDASIDHLGNPPTIFYEDEAEDLLVGACPGRPEFGYFGYLKKMVLTLHNIRVMKSGNLPFHGALVQLHLRGSKKATLLFIGDSGAGKSETLQALQTIATDTIEDMVVIADDMGSITLSPEGAAMGFGTEIGAFLRLDDLKPGYAFGQIDRAIIMSPNKVNARIVLPVTAFSNVIKGFEIDYIFYANNYEAVDDTHPVLAPFDTAEDALATFREGKVMSKGTTTTTGIVHSYFANIFGPVQYRGLHDKIAERFFQAFYRKGLYIGQMRTQLGIPGKEHSGPEESAQALMALILK